MLPLKSNFLMYVIGWSGTVGKWRIYEKRYKKAEKPLRYDVNRAFFMHSPRVDKLPFCWPEDTKAEFLLVHLVLIKATGRL